MAEQAIGPRLTPRVLLIVVDGLRHDTALESGWMPELERRGRAGSTGVLLATPVTMTGVGVRAIGTGVSPSFVDLVRNWSLPPFELDNVFSQLHRRGGRAVVMGNKTWGRLFGAWVERVSAAKAVMKLLNPVYGGDERLVRQAIERAPRQDWDLMVVHIGGVDNASHRFTPSGERFIEKIAQTDRDVAALVDAAGERTTVLVTSDHGATDQGHHGSPELVVRATPLVAFGPGIAKGRGVAALQVDLPATLSALLGLPVPSLVEGRVITEVLDLDAATASAIDRTELARHQRYADAYAARHDLDSPRLPDTTALSSWLAVARARASLVPALWAIALGLVLLALVVAPSVSRRAALLWSAVAATGVVGVASGPAAIIGGLAAAGAAAATAMQLAGVWRRPGWRAAGWLAITVALETAVALWRIRRREVAFWLRDVGALKVGLYVVAGGLAAAALWRRLRAGAISPWTQFSVIFLLSLAGDDMVLPCVVGCGLVATAALSTRGELAKVAAVWALAIAVTVASPPAWTATRWVEAAGPLLVCALAMLVRRGWLWPVLALSGCALVALGRPPMATVAFLLIGTGLIVGASARARGAAAFEILGLGAVALLAVLSRGPDVLGLLSWATAAVITGRTARLSAGDGRAVLAMTLAALALRFGLFGLFEGGFAIAELEIWLGHLAGPTAYVFGGILIGIKFSLPFVVVLGLVTTHADLPTRRRVALLLAAFLGMRVVHVVAALTVAREHFYGPYRDAGHLVITLMLLTSLALAGLVFTARSVAAKILPAVAKTSRQAEVVSSGGS